MAIDYKFDRKLNLVMLTIHGFMDVDDWEAALRRQIADGHWQDGTLMCARDRMGPHTTDDLFRFAHTVNTLIARHGPRGPVAFVSNDAHDYGQSFLYGTLVGTLFPYGSFRTRGAAIEWLRAHVGPHQAAGL